MGALVNSVERDGPAAKAGVEAGDIIVKVDNRDVRASNDLPRIITSVRPARRSRSPCGARARRATSPSPSPR
jgi:serine protease Do